MNEMFGYDEPCFVISVAARIVGVRTQTLRYYERLGLVTPSRPQGTQRMYSRRDVERVQRIRTFMDEWGVNLAGAEVVLRLLDRLQESQEEIRLLKAENRRLESLLGAADGP
jgi:MerR family transcriptional regulator/heat shock protein HspR